MNGEAINGNGGQVRATYPKVTPPAGRPRRICRTPQEAFQAGWDDGADDPPLTPDQVTRLAALLGPSIRACLAQTDQAWPENAA